MNVLILCTGNSCRSQMAEGILRNLMPGWQIFSAGTVPAHAVNPYAIRAMSEIGIDISHHEPHSVERYVAQNFDYIITVCDNARDVCPVFTGSGKQLHIGFDDPADAEGTDNEKMVVYRSARDEIATDFAKWVASVMA